MDLLRDIEAHRYDVLEELYTILSSHIFSDDIKLTGSTRYSLCGKFKHLETIVKHTNEQWWDRFFLEKYISTKISPRGLRVTKDCPFLNVTNKKEWETISEFCTSKWMEILIEHRQHLFEKLRSEATTLAKGITDQKITVPVSWLMILKQNTKSDEDFVIKTKIGKFKRDLDDFNFDRVFNWKLKNRPPIHDIKPTRSSHLHPHHPVLHPMNLHIGILSHFLIP